MYRSYVTQGNKLVLNFQIIESVKQEIKLRRNKHEGAYL